MKYRKRIASALRIQPGEGRLIGLLFMLSFCIGSTVGLANSAATALFLVDWGAANLPIVYICTAFVALLIGSGFARLERRLALSRLLVAVQGLLFVMAGALYIGLVANGALAEFCAVHLVLRDADLERPDVLDVGWALVSSRTGQAAVWAELNHLHAREVFGEMALLDPQPRGASVTAVQDTQLLRLDAEPLSILIDERIEIARGIIKILVRHLRGRGSDLRAARGSLPMASEAVQC